MRKVALFTFCSVMLLLSAVAQEMCVENLKKHVTILASDSLMGRGLGDSGIVKARKYIVNEFESIGLKPFKGSFEFPFEFRTGNIRVKASNLIAVIESSDSVYKNEYIVLGAHYDHLGWNKQNGKTIIFNGANDNASGVAVLLELARMLQASKRTLKRSVLIIAFDAEESGLIGSSKLFSDSILNPAELKCMFSIDMVGAYNKNKGVELIGFKNIVGYEQILKACNKSNAVRIAKVNSILSGGTDTKPFGLRGIPAVSVNTGINSPYHKPEDDSNLLDYVGMDSTTSFMYNLTLELASINDLPKLNTYSKSQDRFSYSIPYIRMSVGRSYFNYVDEYFNGKPVMAFELGVFYQIKLSKHFAVQPELLYANSGGETGYGVLRNQYVKVPIHIQFGTNNWSRENIYCMFGGYYQYCFSTTINGEKSPIYSNSELSQWGLSYGVGVSFSKIQFSVFAHDALTNSAKSLGEKREKATFFSLGFKF
jgi:aminopeptidase YwaD